MKAIRALSVVILGIMLISPKGIAVHGSNVGPVATLR